MNSVACLCDDVISIVYEFLEIHDKLKAKRVSKAWNRAKFYHCVFSRTAMEKIDEEQLSIFLKNEDRIAYMDISEEEDSRFFNLLLPHLPNYPALKTLILKAKSIRYKGVKALQSTVPFLNVVYIDTKFVNATNMGFHVFNKAYALLEDGSYEEAINVYKDMLTSTPYIFQTAEPTRWQLTQVAVVWNNIGYSLYCIGKYEESISWFQKIIKEDDPLNTLALANEGFSRFMMDEYDAALELWNKALEVDTKRGHSIEHGRSLAIIGKGFIEYKKGNVELANQMFQDALHDADGHNIFYSLIHLGEGMAKFGNFEEAIMYYDQCLERKNHKDISNRREKLQEFLQVKKTDPTFCKFATVH